MADYPKSWVGFHRYSLVLAGGAIAVTHDATEDMAYYASQVSVTNGDAFQLPLYLVGGLYSLSVHGLAGSFMGKLDWYLDGILVLAGQDWYAAATTRNVIKTATVAVVGNGRHLLRVVANGKNGLSTGFAILLTTFSLV